MADSMDTELVEAVLLASRALVAVAARSLSAAPEEVTLPQYRALVVLASKGPQSAAGLASEFNIAPSSVTRMCDRLLRKGLISRAEVPENRRQVAIRISPTGQALVDAVTQARRAEIAALVEAIPPARRRLVVDALAELGRAAGEVPDQAWSSGWAG